MTDRIRTGDTVYVLDPSHPDRDVPFEVVAVWWTRQGEMLHLRNLRTGAIISRVHPVTRQSVPADIPSDRYTNQ